jgi:thiamine biosynthesis lipoprotein
VTDAYVHSFTSMGTVVTIHVVGHGTNDGERLERQRAVESAAAWFDEVERTCSRFDPESELAQLSAQIGKSVRVSELLFETVRFALAVATESGGAFDPTVGLLLETRGFDREHRTGRAVHTELDVDRGASFRDVQLDTDERTITLARPMLLDLGAVAKGLAIDMAARELKENSFDDFAIDAGGDLFLAGCNADGQLWSVGVRHPRNVEDLYATLRVSKSAVCTSGDYERRAPGGDRDHHLVDPRTSASASTAASVTVLAPSAMVADALATAAFVLGPVDGIALLERHGLDGFIIAPTLERVATHGMRADYLVDARPAGIAP